MAAANLLRCDDGPITILYREPLFLIEKYKPAGPFAATPKKGAGPPLTMRGVIEHIRRAIPISPNVLLARCLRQRRLLPPFDALPLAADAAAYFKGQ